MSGMSGKMPLGNLGSLGGGGGSLSLVQDIVPTSDPSTSSTSYVALGGGFDATLPNDGKKYLIIMQMISLTESGIGTKIYLKMNDGTTDQGEVSRYTGGSAAGIPMLLIGVYVGGGQTVKPYGKISNGGSMRIGAGTIYGSSRVQVYLVS